MRVPGDTQGLGLPPHHPRNRGGSSMRVRLKAIKTGRLERCGFYGYYDSYCGNLFMLGPDVGAFVHNISLC